MAAEPKQLRGGEPRQGAVPGQFDQPAEADPLLDLLALGAGPLVVPEDGRTQDALLRVEDDQAMHLSREPYRVVAAEPPKGRVRGAHPVVGILLGPTRPRRRQRVFLLGATGYGAVGRERERLDTRRSDVEADERGHEPASPAASIARSAMRSSSSPGRPLTPTAPT